MANYFEGFERQSIHCRNRTGTRIVDSNLFRENCLFAKQAKKMRARSSQIVERKIHATKKRILMKIESIATIHCEDMKSIKKRQRFEKESLTKRAANKMFEKVNRKIVNGSNLFQNRLKKLEKISERLDGVNPI